MIRRPPRSTRTDTLFPYTTLFRAEVERILPGELEPLDPAARPVRRLRYGSKPAAGLIVHENGDGFVDDEAVDFLPEESGGKQPLISEIMLETKAEQIGRASCRERVCQYV